MAMEEAVDGENFPPIHPNCRCVTVTADVKLTSRSARDPVTGENYKVAGDMSFEQWKKNLSDEQKQAFDLHVRQMRNKSADQKQYKRYLERLGAENLPKTFDKFQEMKYTDVEKWEELKLAYKEGNYLQKQLPYIYNGKKEFVPNKTLLKNVKTIAGLGSKDAIRDEPKLIEQYGGNVGEWRKRVGKVESSKYIFDIHWYELNGKQYETKLKHRKER